MQLTENVMLFKIANSNGGDDYLDIAEAMSVVNRKLNRQQGLWTVLGLNFFAEQGSGAPVPGTGCFFEVGVYGAPRNWVTRNALVKAFEHWKEQQAEAYAASSPSIKPRWQDFKVYLNEDHRAEVAAGTELLPWSGGMFGSSDQYNAAEDWVHSRLVYTDLDGGGLPDTHEPELQIMGVPTQCVSLIRQYQISRARVISPDPDVPSAITTSIYTQMDAGLSEKVEEITINLLDQNDEPPYDVDDYPGGTSNGTEPVLYGFATNSSTQRRKVSIPGFGVPNGLLKFSWNANIVNPEGVVTGIPADLWIQVIVGGRRPY